jgi:hypothetical protein
MAARRSLRDSYGLSKHRLRRGGSRYVVILDAAQSIPRGSYLTFSFQATQGGCGAPPLRLSETDREGRSEVLL